MGKRKRLLGVLLVIAALIIMTLPVSEADAASSASDFVMEGSTLVKYRGTEKNVSVPDTVEVIGESAFEDKTGIELVVIPNSVKRIEAYAFWGCDNLDTVVLGKGLTEVGDYAFAGCKGLEQMSIPSNVRTIGIQAFGDCVNMTDISIPVETVNIHESAFDGCAKLTIHCQEGSVADLYAQKFYERQKEMPEYEDVPGYSDSNGSNNQEETTPAPVATEAPQTTSAPHDTAGIVLGTTQVVGNRAVVFVDAGELEVKQEQSAAASVGNTVPGILEDTAQLVSGLLNADNIPKYTIVDGRIVADQAYYRNNSLQEVFLPKGIVEIGEFAFARSALTGIQVPDGVTDIAYGAFYHCDSLTEVTLPETVRNLEPKAFAKTGWVENFLQETSAGDFLVSGGVLVAYRGNSADVILPEGVRVIAAEAFQGHDEIESLILPDSVRVIGEAAFEDCSGLKEVQLNQGLEQIKDRAFCGDVSADISVPASVKELGLQAFEGVAAEFEGDIPDKSYESSATRLSNEAYRGLAEEDAEVGVTVVGLEGACASLEGAARHYELTVRKAEDNEGMQEAWNRATGDELPADMAVYELKLTDSSGIPLTKLGHQTLTVTLPVPDNLTGQELRAVMTDRNGQLEAVPAQRVLLDGNEALCIQTTYLSLFGIYSVGEAGGEELQEITVSMQSSAAPPAESGKDVLFIRCLIGGALLITGSILCFSGHRKRIETKYIL